MDNQKLWQAMLGSLEINLSKGNFITWFKNTGIIEKDGDYIIVGVPSTFAHEWIKNKFHNHLLKSLKTIAPEVREIRYHIGNLKPLIVEAKFPAFQFVALNYQYGIESLLQRLRVKILLFIKQ